MKALVAGAGIGGLSAAICLALRGWEVTVFERAPRIEEIGAGLQISANGYRVLEAMGVAPHLTATRFLAEAIEMRMGRSERQLFRVPVKDASPARWGAPYAHIHRADLLAALLARAADLPNLRVQEGAEVLGVEHHGDGITARLQGGDETGDILIGADGVRSRLRAEVCGSSAPRFTGNLAWRTVVPLAALDRPPPPTACVWAGAKRHAVTTRLRAGQMVNFVGIVESKEDPGDGWDRTGARTEALRDFAGWSPTLTEILKRAETLHRWSLYDHAPLPRWHKGRLCLLGDACHPMLPSMAQGAVQAIEDAWVLAGCLATGTAEQAFQRYVQLRRARTEKVQTGSARNLRIFHRKHALQYAHIYLAGRLLPELILRRQDWVYGHDVLGEVPSL